MRVVTEEQGQSLAEIALVVPLLVLILLGVADLGRALYYVSAIANAAREAAAYAAMNSSATIEAVRAKACNETGFVAYATNPTCPGLTVAAQYGPGQDAVVTVNYDFRFISSFLVGRVFDSDRLVLRASATFPGLSP